jgi:hypothetical protein
MTMSVRAGIKMPEKEDFAEQWKWALSVLPQLSGYQPLDLGGSPMEELRKWVPPGKSITVYDERCRPIRVSLHEGVLSGDTNIQTTYHKGVKKVEALTVEYGTTIAYLGPGWTEYEKNAKGKWVEVGGGGMGCLETRPGVLNKVTRDAAWYGGFVASLNVVCGSPLSWTDTCLDGSSRVCKKCNSLRLEVHSVTPGIGVGRFGTTGAGIHPDKPVDCSIPCPVDTKANEREKLNRILKGREFLSIGTGQGVPTLFRFRKTCEKYRIKPRTKRSLPCSGDGSPP